MKELILTTEIQFWDTVILLMKQSKFIQLLLKFVYPFVEGLRFDQIIKTISITCISGFVLGWFAFYTYFLTK